jgi:hypothetical protein
LGRLTVQRLQWLAIDRVFAGRRDDGGAVLRRNSVRGDLVAEEVEVDPDLALAAHPAVE